MASVLLQNFGEMLMTFPALKMSHFPCMFYSINSCLKWYNSIYTHRTNTKLFILSHTLVLIKKIKGNKETSLVYFCYQSSNINCQKGNSYCEIAQVHYHKQWKRTDTEHQLNLQMESSHFIKLQKWPCHHCSFFHDLKWCCYFKQKEGSPDRSSRRQITSRLMEMLTILIQLPMRF